MPDPVHEEPAALEARVVEAERAAREVDAQACEAANRLELASSEFASLPPEELDATGNPRPKTTAATLAAEIQKLKTPPVSWSRRAEQAHTTARRARLELDRFEGANVATIVKAEEHLGREAGDNLRAQLTGVIAAIDNWHHTQAHFSGRVTKAQGLTAQTELPSAFADRLSNLRRDIQKVLPDVADPLPRSILPAAGEVPPRVPSGDGWIAIQHLGIEEEREAKRGKQQAQEQPRRGVRYRPPQPEPTPQTLRDMHSRGWR